MEVEGQLPLQEEHQQMLQEDQEVEVQHLVQVQQEQVTLHQLVHHKAIMVEHHQVQ